jgi:hypothetical protein
MPEWSLMVDAFLEEYPSMTRSEIIDMWPKEGENR